MTFLRSQVSGFRRLLGFLILCGLDTHMVSLIIDEMLTVFCPGFKTLSYLEDGEWIDEFLEIVRRGQHL